MKTVYFNFPLFCDLKLEVFYGDKSKSWEAIQKSFKEKEKDVDCGEDLEENSGASYFRLGHFPKIWLAKLPRDAESRAIAAHEAVHIIDWLCTTTGIDDKEFRGYMVGHIIRMLETASKKYKK